MWTLIVSSSHSFLTTLVTVGSITILKASIKVGDQASRRRLCRLSCLGLASQPPIASSVAAYENKLLKTRERFEIFSYLCVLSFLIHLPQSTFLKCENKVPVHLFVHYLQEVVLRRWIPERAREPDKEKSWNWSNHVQPTFCHAFDVQTV